MSDGLGPQVTRKGLLQAGLAGGVLLSAGGLAACGGGGGGGGGGTATSTTATAATPRTGGRFRYSVIGDDADTLDAHIGSGANERRFAFAINMFATLVRQDADFKPHPWLAEELTPNGTATAWTIRLREGAMFSDGRPITADDVAYSLRRILDPKNGASAFLLISAIDPKRIDKLDRRTLRVHLTRPDVVLDIGLMKPSAGIVPADYDPRNPVSSGAFVIAEPTVSDRMLFRRNENFWIEGRPYLDELELVRFADVATAANGLRSGEVDGLGKLTSAQIELAKSDDSVTLVEAETGGCLPITMRADRGPFKDERVRMAMKLIADRQQLIDQALGGHGRLGNDIPSIQDPHYPSDIPQREPDIEQAKSLLKAAGAEGLSATLVTRPQRDGLVESAQVFAQQAKAAGVDIRIQNVTDISQYYAEYNGKADFTQDSYFTNGLFAVFDLGLSPDAPYNTTYLDDPQTFDLVRQARATLDEAKRKELVAEAMERWRDVGTWVLWGFNTITDAISTRFTGALPDSSVQGLNGLRFDEIGLAQ